jgi:hypothetical protein
MIRIWLNSHLHDYPHSQDTIEHITTEIQNIFHDSASASFPNKSNMYITTNRNSYTNKSWFDPKCFKARNNYHNFKAKYLSNRTDLNKTRMRDASKQYKRTMDFYIKREKQNNATKLRNLSETQN